MKEYKPEGTPEANELSRKRLSRLFTGKEDAGSEEMLKAINKPSRPEPKIESIKSSLLALERLIEDWEGKFIGSKKFEMRDMIIVARRILDDIEREEKKEENSMVQFKKKHTKKEQEQLADLLQRLEFLKYKLTEIIREGL